MGGRGSSGRTVGAELIRGLRAVYGVVNISQSESIGLVGFGEYLPRFPQHRTMRLPESWSAAQSQRPNSIVINTQFASRSNFTPDAHEARNF